MFERVISFKCTYIFIYVHAYTYICICIYIYRCICITYKYSLCSKKLTCAMGLDDLFSGEWTRSRKKEAFSCGLQSQLRLWRSLSKLLQLLKTRYLKFVCIHKWLLKLVFCSSPAFFYKKIWPNVFSYKICLQRNRQYVYICKMHVEVFVCIVYDAAQTRTNLGRGEAAVTVAPLTSVRPSGPKVGIRGAEL